MTARLGTKLGEWLWKRNAIEKRQIDEIRYAFEILCSEFLEVIVILGFGLMYHKIVFTFIYLILFHYLRKAFQGYHAKTIWKCFLLTISAYLVCMSAFNRISEITILLFLIVSFLLQVNYCMLHKDVKPMLLTISLICIGAFIYTMGHPHYIQMLSCVELLVSISLLPERMEICRKEL